MLLIILTVQKRDRPGEGGVGTRGALPLMAYAGRLRLKGVSFSGFRHIKV